MRGGGRETETDIDYHMIYQFWVYVQKKENRNQNTYSPTYILSTMIHTSQVMEAVYVSMYGGMCEQNVLDLSDGFLNFK